MGDLLFKDLLSLPQSSKSNYPACTVVIRNSYEKVVYLLVIQYPVDRS